MATKVETGMLGFILYMVLTKSQCDNYNAATSLHFPVAVGYCYYSLSTVHQQMSKQYICQDDDMNGTKAVEYVYDSMDCTGLARPTGFNYSCDSPEDHCQCTTDYVASNMQYADLFTQKMYFECDANCNCDVNKYQIYIYLANICMERVEGSGRSNRFMCSNESLVATSVSDCGGYDRLNDTNQTITSLDNAIPDSFGQCFEKQCGNVIGPRVMYFKEKEKIFGAFVQWQLDIFVVLAVFVIVVGGVCCAHGKKTIKFNKNRRNIKKRRGNYQRTYANEHQFDNEHHFDATQLQPLDVSTSQNY
eukprot:74796_1